MKPSEAITFEESAQMLHEAAKALRELNGYRNELIRNLHLGNNSLQTDGEPTRELLLVANTGLQKLDLEHKAMSPVDITFLVEVVTEFDIDPDIIEGYLQRLRPKSKKWWEF